VMPPDELLAKMINQRHDVLAAIAQRRQAILIPRNNSTACKKGASGKLCR
jgi:hypothetical protein